MIRIHFITCQNDQTFRSYNTCIRRLFLSHILCITNKWLSVYSTLAISIPFLILNSFWLLHIVFCEFLFNFKRDISFNLLNFHIICILAMRWPFNYVISCNRCVFNFCSPTWEQNHWFSTIASSTEPFTAFFLRVLGFINKSTLLPFVRLSINQCKKLLFWIKKNYIYFPVR